jgi:hypothetical protein
MFGNNQIQSTLNGLRFGAGAQDPLGALDLYRIQTEVFVCSCSAGRHSGVLFSEYTAAMYTEPAVVNIRL